MADNQSTPGSGPEFDFDAFPPDTCFHERRTRSSDRVPAEPPRSSGPRPARKERRRRVDPTTFEKQYTPEELEFMNAMQRFKVRTGKTFPSFGDVLGVARALGYEQTGTHPNRAGNSPAPDRS